MKRSSKFLALCMAITFVHFGSASGGRGVVVPSLRDGPIDESFISGTNPKSRKNQLLL